MDIPVLMSKNKLKSFGFANNLTSMFSNLKDFKFGEVKPIEFGLKPKEKDNVLSENSVNKKRPREEDDDDNQEEKFENSKKQCLNQNDFKNKSFKEEVRAESKPKK